MKRTAKWGLLTLMLGLGTVVAPRVADACGGCFSPPMTVQTVTYHRMALSVSATRTTLWDQFGYTGRPEEFSWILPIQGGPEVRVELADVRFLAALDDASAAQLPPPPQQPTRSCPVCYTPPPEVQYYCADARFAGAARDASAFAADAPTPAPSDGGVTVLREEVVGPYQVVTLRGDDAMTLRAWLTTNNYAVPPAMEPVLDHYIGLRMDFVALRLRDGVGLGRMQPVRVTMPGYQPVLPLRMVAAGVADSVELALFTLADSRMEPANFPAIEIPNDDLTWTFGRDTDPAEVFRRAERELRASSGGRGWLTESADTTTPIALDALAATAALRWRAESDAGSPMADMAVAIATLGSAPVLTRLHADLAVAALDRDLMLGASTRGDHDRVYRFRHTEGTLTPASCPALQCATGLVYGGEGEIRDPFGQALAPDAVLPSRYTRGSLPAFTPRFGYAPRYQDGRAYTPPRTVLVERCSGPGATGPGSTGARTGSGCSASAALPGRSRSADGLIVLALVAGAAARRARRRD